MKNFTNLRHSLLFCVVSVSVFATRLLPAQEAASEPKGKYTPGRTQSRTYFFKAADKKMPFSIYVPKGYDKKKSYPLMVALHGLGSSHWQIIRYPGLTRLAQKHGYIVVAPMGYNSSGWYGADGRFTRFTSKKILRWSEQDVMNVLAITRKELSIDDQRIFLMGHSMGGGGAWHLGMKFPDLWAALAPVAPASPRNINDLKKINHVPVIVVCGDKDGLVRSARVWVARMKELEMNYKYVEVKGGNHLFPAIQKLPDIFDFFNKQTKAPAKKKDSRIQRELKTVPAE
jgi:poly(3-hydroxybutyrate) depolymerase